MPSTAAWVDTGFLVALFARNDAYHDSAISFLRDVQAIEFHSIWPVVAEASFFLDAAGKAAMLDWLQQGPIVFHEIGIRDLGAIGATLKKYRNLAPDFTDATLVTMAGIQGIEHIVTVDVRDFSAYRIGGKGKFIRLWR